MGCCYIYPENNRLCDNSSFSVTGQEGSYFGFFEQRHPLQFPCQPHVYCESSIKLLDRLEFLYAKDYKVYISILCHKNRSKKYFTYGGATDHKLKIVFAYILLFLRGQVFIIGNKI